MTPRTQANNSDPHSPAALIGFDWGDSFHAIAIEVPGQPVQNLKLNHSPELLLAWAEELQLRFGGAFVDIAVEATRGAVVYCLSAFPWIRIFPIHPTTSSKQRTAFRPSGAKDDTHDAVVLLDILRTQRHRLRQLSLDDSDTRLLAELTSSRRKAVDLRSKFSNELTSTLKDYFPQALSLFGENPTAPLAMEFLTKWRSLIDIQSASDKVISHFYTTHNVRSKELIDARIKQVRSSKSLTHDTAIVTARCRTVRMLIGMLEPLREHISEYDNLIAEVFARHPDHGLFGTLPGAGPVMAPRLLAAFGTDRERFPNPEAAQKALGVAPVTESSGQRRWVHWRMAAPTFPRQSLVEWAGQTVIFSAWARAYYEQKKAKGVGRNSALRSLAFKWVRIVWKCWRERRIYSEKEYLAQLEKRGAPIASRAMEIAREMGI